LIPLSKPTLCLPSPSSCQPFLPETIASLPRRFGHFSWISRVASSAHREPVVVGFLRRCLRARHASQQEGCDVATARPNLQS
jgi:hypothetical protein